MRYIPNRTRVVTDQLPDGTIGILHHGFGGDIRVVHRQADESVAGSRTLFAGEEVDIAILAAELGPVIHCLI
jgi:hypothetical protein